MNNKDSIAKEFIKINKVFADVFNGHCFHGNRVLMPNALTPVDAVGTIARASLTERVDYSELFDDIIERSVVRTDGKTIFLLLPVIDQNTVDERLLMQFVLYSMLVHKEQRRYFDRTTPATGNASAASDLQSNEHTPKGFPIAALVINLSPDKWRWPRSMHVRFEVKEDDPQPTVKLSNDYFMNLLDPYQMNDKDFIVYTSNIREVLLLIKDANNHTALKELTARDERFKNVDRKAVALINACTDLNIKFDETQRTIDMRSAFVEEN